MTVQELLVQAHECGVALVVIGGKLKASPPGVLPPDLKTAIRDRAVEIKGLLPIAQAPTHGQSDAHRRCRCGYRVYDAERVFCPSCGMELFQSNLENHEAEIGLLARSEPSKRPRPPMPLRRCGALICRTCHVHSPSPHREGCAFPQFDPCRSRWFWLSPHGATKCIACAAPASLELVEGWVLARETGEGADGWRIPGEILSLLHVASPPQ